MNSFGFGGTNSHAILDDACHFVKQTGLTANYNHDVSSSTKFLPNGKGHSNGARPNEEHTNGEHTNGEHINEANGIGAIAYNLPDLKPVASDLRILTWSSADEDGITRFAEPWERYFSNETSRTDSDKYLDDLAYTLNRRRSRLPWMTYVLVDERTKLAGIPKAWTPSIRREEALTMAFVFSGVSSSSK